MKTLGIDVGSRSVKFAGLENEIIFTHKEDTVDFYRKCRLGSDALQLERLDFFKSIEFDFEKVTATGYGRYNVNIMGAETISEIKAHAMGAVYQTSLSDFTVIDLGGQDTKVILIRDGRVEDFVMNDKCAAGSGRYLENIANLLKISSQELAKHHIEPAKLSATCAIFGESEVIGKLAEGESLEKICAGANFSVARRAASLLKRYASKQYLVTGGVALNGGVIEFLSASCGGALSVPPRPVFNGAIGCALAAQGRTYEKPAMPAIG